MGVCWLLGAQGENGPQAALQGSLSLRSPLGVEGEPACIDKAADAKARRCGRLLALLHMHQPHSEPFLKLSMVITMPPCCCGSALAMCLPASTGTARAKVCWARVFG